MTWNGVNRKSHSGAIGAKTGIYRDQRKNNVPKTSWVNPQFVLDVRALTGIPNITPTISSVNGMVWYCEAGSARYVVSLRRDITTGEVSLFDLLQIDTNPPLQIGYDWILTRTYFLSLQKEFSFVQDG